MIKVSGPWNKARRTFVETAGQMNYGDTSLPNANIKASNKVFNSAKVPFNYAKGMAKRPNT